MLDGYYTRTELSYIVAMSGFIIFPFWKLVHSVGSIFDSFPGRVHASLVFGVALIVLVKVLYILYSSFLCLLRIFKHFSPQLVQVL